MKIKELRCPVVSFLVALCVVANAHAGPVEEYFTTQFGLTLDSVYWGDPHSHSYYSGDTVLNAMHPDNPEHATPADIFQEARELGFDFSVVTDHAEAAVPSRIPDDAPNVWESQRRMTLAANDEIDDGDGVFFAYMGYEHTNPYPCTDQTPDDDEVQCPSECANGQQSCEAYGHKSVTFSAINEAPNVRVSFLDPAVWTTPERQCSGFRADLYCGFDTYSVYGPDDRALWSWLRYHGYGYAGPQGLSVLTTIHTPGNQGQHTDWDVIDRDFVRQVEIFSVWGNSEGPAPENCINQNDLDVAVPLVQQANDPAQLVRPQIYQRWVIDGRSDYALGFVGGSDDHTGRPGGHGNGDGGVTGIVAPVLTRDGLFDAMARRHTQAATYYRSTGPLPVLFALQSAAQHLMAGDMGVAPRGGVVSLRIWAHPDVEEVQVVVDGCTTRTYPGAVHELRLFLDPQRRHMVYVRARRATTEADAVDEDHAPVTDWNQTWTSPVYLRPRSARD